MDTTLRVLSLAMHQRRGSETSSRHCSTVIRTGLPTDQIARRAVSTAVALNRRSVSLTGAGHTYFVHLPAWDRPHQHHI